MANRLALATSSFGFIFALGMAAYAQQSPTLSDADYARQALAAGPKVVANGASVVRPENDGMMRTLRAGTNGFTCLIMGTDRMCADNNGMQFIHAMMSQQPPPNQLGLAYMLGGDTGPSGEVGGEVTLTVSHWKNAQQPLGRNRTTHHAVWSAKQDAGLPEAVDPDPSKPYMMWANTPYEHAMVPVK